MNAEAQLSCPVEQIRLIIGLGSTTSTVSGAITLGLCIFMRDRRH